MPHTTRKKKNQPPKRVQVTDDDGWTTVTTTRPQRRSVRNALNTTPSPAPPDPGVTLEKLKQQYARQETLWLQSAACSALKTLIKESVCPAVKIDKLIIFGSGSTCGGWRRHDVALTQIAALKSIAGAIEAETGRAVPMYAQDPTYNHLDRELLSSLGYETVRDPEGFDLVTGKSLVYTPGAEFHVEMGVLARFPAVLLTGKLDWYWRNDKGIACTNRISSFQQEQGKISRVSDVKEEEEVEGNKEVQGNEDVDIDIHDEQCQIFERFRQSKDEASLPTFEDRDWPFYRQFLYWPKSTDVTEDRMAEELARLALDK